VPKEVERVSNLIKNLIDYAKPEISSIEIINISDLVNSSTSLIAHVLKNERITLNTDVDKELTIEADENQVKQVLINIILNSAESVRDKIKNSSESKDKLNIFIRAWEDKEVIFIQITDEGMGMTRDEIKKSTDPFFTTKSVGTGLGLYISKQYVEKNGGTLSIESEKYLYTRITLRFGR
jgi:polar amino acid transport system substrate-binding protein